LKRADCTITFTGDIGFDKYMDGKWNDDTLLSDNILRNRRQYPKMPQD